LRREFSEGRAITGTAIKAGRILNGRYRVDWRAARSFLGPLRALESHREAWDLTS
jgi:hypothetical protein